MGHIHIPGEQLERWFLRVLASFAAAEVWPVTDLLEISSFQRLVPHLTEVHVTVVMALFPLKQAHKTHPLTRSLINTEQWMSSHAKLQMRLQTFRQGGASRSVDSRKQPSDDFLLEPWRKRKQNWVSPRQPGKWQINKKVNFFSHIHLMSLICTCLYFHGVYKIWKLKLSLFSTFVTSAFRTSA